MQFKDFKPGMVVYSVEKHTMGNTTMKTTGVYSVYIVRVIPNPEYPDQPGRVEATWNGNPPRLYSRAQYSKWKKVRPTLVRGPITDRVITSAENKRLTAWLLKHNQPEYVKCQLCNTSIILKPHLCTSIRYSTLCGIIESRD